jgi:hypothetical protein
MREEKDPYIDFRTYRKKTLMRAERVVLSSNVIAISCETSIPVSCR